MKLLVFVIAAVMLFDISESFLPSGSFKPSCKNKCTKNSDCKSNQKCVKIIFCKVCFSIPTIPTNKPPTIPTTKPTTASTTKATTASSTKSTTASTTKPPNTCEPPETSATTNVRCFRGHDKGDTCVATCKAGWCRGSGRLPFTTCKCNNGKCGWDRDVSNFCNIQATDKCKSDADCSHAAKPSCRQGLCGKECMPRIGLPISPISSCPVPEPNFSPSRIIACPKVPCTSNSGCEDNEVCCSSHACKSTKCQSKSNNCPATVKNPCITDADCISRTERCIWHKDGCKKCSPGFICPGRVGSCADDKACKTGIEICAPGDDGCRVCTSTLAVEGIHMCKGLPACRSVIDCNLGRHEMCLTQRDGCKRCQQQLMPITPETPFLCPTPDQQCRSSLDCNIQNSEICQLAIDGCRRCMASPRRPPIPTCPDTVVQCKSLTACGPGERCMMNFNGCMTCQSVV